MSPRCQAFWVPPVFLEMLTHTGAGQLRLVSETVWRGRPTSAFTGKLGHQSAELWQEAAKKVILPSASRPRPVICLQPHLPHHPALVFSSGLGFFLPSSLRLVLEGGREGRRGGADRSQSSVQSLLGWGDPHDHAGLFSHRKMFVLKFCIMEIVTKLLSRGFGNLLMFRQYNYFCPNYSAVLKFFRYAC